MVHVDNDAFLTGLTKLFQQTRHSGSVFITMKKYNGRTKPHPKPRSKPSKSPSTSSASSAAARKTSPEPDDHLCLLRAGNGKRTLSTVISAKEVTKFHMAYTNILKANMDGLRKRDKKQSTDSPRKKQSTDSPRKKGRRPPSKPASKKQTAH